MSAPQEAVRAPRPRPLGALAVDVDGLPEGYLSKVEPWKVSI